MMREIAVVLTLLCCGLLCASPYGRALKQARQAANRPHPAEKELNMPEKRAPEKRTPAKRAPEKRAPEHRPAPAVQDDFGRIWHQMGGVIKLHKGCLPGPAGVEGLRKICGPGRIAPELLKVNDFKKLTEKNCAWAYVGGALGVLQSLPQGGEFPILFTKPRLGVMQIKVLTANGTVKTIDGRRVTSSAGVINVLRRSSRNAQSPVWKKLSIAAGQIDRANR